VWLEILRRIALGDRLMRFSSFSDSAFPHCEDMRLGLQMFTEPDTEKLDVAKVSSARRRRQNEMKQSRFSEEQKIRF